MSGVNSSVTNPNETPFLEPGVSSNIGIAILSIAFIIGFPGNAFVIWTIWTQIKKRTVTCLLILNLAMADIILILTIPFFLHLRFTSSWIFGNIFCKICYYVCCLSMYTSTYLIVFMSIDRFLALIQPFTFQKLRTKQPVRVLIALIWISACLFASTMFIYRGVMPRNGDPQCIPIHESPKHVVFHYVFETLTGCVIPFTIIVSCYVYIGLRLRTAKFHTRQKMGRLVIMIIVTFALFWLPYHMVNMLIVSGEIIPSPSLTKAANRARSNSVTLIYLSSSANPILYVFAAGNFIKTAGMGFMAKLFEGAASETSRKMSYVLRH
ncbi:hypothetical protein GDO78_007243 [Eleutherodactylus coqui]|uniref:G-protein coupled receptors family 1 profile domain-containing protein n=1 Tax=Eleutherodactylus coqui TaxID=57060 RepID=A0A8J6FGL4_ELECQ|nr:hypothetical protein GDO78_007243 [Eleutherodactylus coqui]